MTPIDPKKVRLKASAEVPGSLFAVAVDEGRRRLYGAGSDGGLHLFDLKSLESAAVADIPLHDNYVSGLAMRDGELISCGYDGRINWTDPESGRRIRSVVAHAGWVRKLALTPDLERLVTVGDDMAVRVHDAGTGERLLTLLGHDGRTPEGYLSALYAVAVDGEGRYAASGDRAGFVRVWELASGKLVTAFRAAEFYTFDAVKRARAIGGVRGLCFSPDGSRLVVSGIGAVSNVDGFVGPCRVESWDWRAGKRIAVGQERHNAILNHVAFTSKDTVAAVGGGDGGGALLFWAAGGNPTLVKPKGHLHAFVIDKAGGLLCAVGHGGFQVWVMG